MNELTRTPHPLAVRRGAVVPRGHLVLMCVVALAAAAWGWVLIALPESPQRLSFLIVLGLYGTGSALFIASRMRDGRFRLFDIPTFVTLLAFVEFGLAPVACFLIHGEFDPSFHSPHASFVRTLAALALGMAAFWVGCRLAAHQRPAVTAAPPGAASAMGLCPPLGPVVISALGLYALAFAVKGYLLENFGYDYGVSQELYLDHLAAMQVANVVFQAGTYALVILAIERSFHRYSLDRKVLFWVVFLMECFWGLVSGMKSNLLQNFVLVAVVSSLAERKLKTRWVVAALLGLVVIYPFSIQYRELVRSRADEAMGVGGAERIAASAFEQAIAGDSTPVDWLESGLGASVSRLNLLQSVTAVLALGPKGDWLKGGERWWMLPFYPFVPRFIWTSKPILDKGRRFSLALGDGDQTATAITYPGDLYFEYGLPGLLAGMLLFGMVTDWLTNRFSVPGSKPRLFIYTGAFITVVFGIELDAFDFWSTLIRSMAILSLVARVVYRPSFNLQQSSTRGRP
ncbi:MAG TPA: hypothetical protein VL523_02220 [Terriglobia bacterium]|nr:hypothetical protein [Terriglobia bacterium]